MADATGEAKEPPLRLSCERRPKLEFHGARITSDGGLLAYPELDDALGLTATAASALAEGRRGKNIHHHPLGLLRQAVYGRLAGYEATTKAGAATDRRSLPTEAARAGDEADDHHKCQICISIKRGMRLRCRALRR